MTKKALPLAGCPCRGRTGHRRAGESRRTAREGRRKKSVASRSRDGRPARTRAHFAGIPKNRSNKYYPVDDEDALEFVLQAELARGDRHGVEEAEAHRLLRLGVMAGRPDHGETVLYLVRDGCVIQPQFVRYVFKANQMRVVPSY